MAYDTLLLIRLVLEDIGMQLLENFDGCIDFVHQRTGSVALSDSILLIQIASSLQTPYKLCDDNLLGTDGGLDSATASLKGRLTHVQDLPLGISALLMKPVKCFLFSVGMEKNMHEQFAGLSTVNKEEHSGSLKVCRLGITDGDTERCGEGFTKNGSGVGSQGGFIHVCKKLILGLI